MMSTACYKGFIITFRVRYNQLYIDELDVYCPDDVYPAINGVEATDDGMMGACSYKNLNIATKYTGTIMISKGLKNGAIRGAFLDGPGLYRQNFELDFENGKLVAYRETTGQYNWPFSIDDEG